MRLEACGVRLLPCVTDTGFDIEDFVVLLIGNSAVASCTIEHIGDALLYEMK